MTKVEQASQAAENSKQTRTFFRSLFSLLFLIFLDQKSSQTKILRNCCSDSCRLFSVMP